MSNKILRRADLSVHENVVFLSVVSIFLPYYVTIIIVTYLGFYVLFKTDVKETVFAHLGSWLVPVFSAVTLITAICYKNILGFFCSLLFFILFILSFYLRTIITTELFEKALDLMCVCSVFASAVVILEKIIYINAYYHRCCGDFFNNYYFSFYFHPNYLGSLMAAVILVCAYKVVVKRNDKKYYYAIAVLAAITVFLTESMFAWIEVLVGLSILLLLARRHQLLSILLIMVAFAAVLLYTAPDIFEKFVPRIMYAGETFSNRILIWDFAIKSIKKAPLFGRGFFTYYQLSLADPSSFQTTHAHNIFLEPLLSFGIIGSLILFAMIFILFYRVVLCKNLLRKSHITTLIFSVTAAILIHSIIDMTMLWVQTALLYCIIMGGIGADERKIKGIFKDRFQKQKSNLIQKEN